MDVCKVSRAAASAPFLRNEINVVHYRPRKEREKVGTENEPDVVCMAFEEVCFCGGFHAYHDTRQLMLTVHNGCVGGVGNRGTR